MKLNKKIAAVISSALLVSALSVSSFAGTYSCDTKADNNSCAAKITCVDDNSCKDLSGLLNLFKNFKTSTSCGLKTDAIKNIIFSLFNR